MIERRQFSYGLLATFGGFLLTGSKAYTQGKDEWSDKLRRRFAELEKERGGRLGVAVADSSTGRNVSYRGDERFPMCSTFKTLAVAAVLARVDSGKEQLDRRIRFDAHDVVVNSPITKDRAGGDGMFVAEICEAAMIVSDNTAG